MTRNVMIERLERLQTQPVALAAEIHRCWTKHRLTDGWTFGCADRLRKTSPYLKPFAQFDSWELKREIGLALNDLRGIAGAIKDWKSDVEFGGATSDAGMATCLAGLQDDDRFVALASIAIHDGWREANRVLCLNADDRRLLQRFDELSTADRHVTLANVRCDIEALARLIAGTDTSSSALDLDHGVVAKAVVAC